MIKHWCLKVDFRPCIDTHPRTILIDSQGKITDEKENFSVKILMKRIDV